MTDLERLWDDLPTPKPPVDAILREGRKTTSVRRKRLISRPLLAGVTVAALAAAFVAGALVGRDDGTPGGGNAQSGADHAAAGGDASPVAFQADLKPAASCDQLLSSYVDRGLGLVTAWGWQQPFYAVRAQTVDGVQAPGSVDMQYGKAAPAATGPRTSRVTGSATGTNVQEAGVDEPDGVKTDGKILVRMHGDELVTYDVSGATAKELSTLALPGLADGELLLSGDTVVALGTDSTAPTDPVSGARRGTRVLAVSIADPAKPAITQDVSYASRLLSARQHGTTVRLVLSAGLPDLDFVTPGKGRTQKEALTANRSLVQKSTINDWLPTYDAGKGARQLLDCHNVAPTPNGLGLDTVSVVGFDATTPQQPQAIGLAGATDIAYESADDLYLAASPSPWGGMEPMLGTVAGPCMDCFVPQPAMPSGGTTYLFDFALHGASATHVASGEVEGTIADRWSMDSPDGTGSLRVAVGPSVETRVSNSIVTFRREGQKLVEAGRISGLGRGEEIKAVRWFDDLAIVVTYRQLDPMYAVDLTDAAKPRLLGKLRIPGYSDYLHPLGPRRLIGVGQGRGWSAQVGLFNVRDLSHPQRIDVHGFGRDTQALAGADPRSFTWLPDQRTAYTVIQRGRVGLLAKVWVHASRLHVTSRPVEVGTDVGQVRTFGMPDGRVLLVTGDDVRFLSE